MQEGGFKGLVCKFAIYTCNAFPLRGSPSIKILSPSGFDHPSLKFNLDDKLALPEWNPDKDSLRTLISYVQQLFERPLPNISPAELVEASRKQIQNSKDIFSPCSPSWTPELLEMKAKILNNSWETPIMKV